MIQKIPGFGLIPEEYQNDLLPQTISINGWWQVGKNGVQRILVTRDYKAEFIVHGDYTLVEISSKLNHSAIYPLSEVTIEKPIKAVFMDLDGTSIKSENFWKGVIQKTVAILKKDPNFVFNTADEPYIIGHSVSEHLQYCLHKYCPVKSLEEARLVYQEITTEELQKIASGNGDANIFKPTEGLKEVLLALKEARIKIALVTSGALQKVYPQIVGLFKMLQLEDPLNFYDTIICGGQVVQKGKIGNLGELALKPHPWLYAEAARIGLGLDQSVYKHTFGIEDTSAGVISLRLAGIPALGINGGNIVSSGARPLLFKQINSLPEIISFL